MSSRDAIARALAGSPAAFDSEGLQQPAIDPIMLFASLGAPGIAKALVGSARLAPGMMASEAGALFPEGMALPIADRAAMREMKDVLPQTQQLYRMNEALANWHGDNMDFPAVLKDKWAMLKHAGGN